MTKLLKAAGAVVFAMFATPIILVLFIKWCETLFGWFGL